MSKFVKVAMLAIGLSAGPLLVAPALADNVTIGIGAGGVAFGYSDGYWDHDHHWHAWRNHEEEAQFREHNRDHYFAQRHDHDSDGGWHEHDHWWDKH